MPNKPTTLREWREKLNNAHITGHISGRHLILLDGKKDRKWDGGGYEENEYRFLDEYVESILTSHNTELLQKIEERQKLFNFIPQDQYGYKMIKATDLDIISLINQNK